MFNWRNIFKDYRTTAVAVVSVGVMVLALVMSNRVSMEDVDIIKEHAMNFWDGLAGLVVAANAVVLALAKDKNDPVPEVALKK